MVLRSVVVFYYGERRTSSLYNRPEGQKAQCINATPLFYLNNIKILYNKFSKHH